MLEIIINSIKDLFDKTILLSSLIPIVISAIFWGVVFFIFSDSIHSGIIYLVSHIPFIGDSNFVANIVEAVGGIFVYYQLLIITSVMIVGVIADQIVDRVNEKYYNLEKQGFGSLAGSIFISLKQNAIFIILFIIFLPTMFVPLLNILVNLFLWAVLIKKPLFYDSVSMYASKEEFEKLQNSNKTMTLIITFISASFFLIPVIGIFVYIIQLLVFTHFNLKRLKKLRK